MLLIRAEFADEFHTDWDKYRLCYARHNIAYFTTKDLEKQSGKFWNMSSVKHAGTPEAPSQTYKGLKGAYPMWGILKIHFSSLHKFFFAPEFDVSYSVSDINLKQKEPWIFRDNFKIYAGIKPKEFLEFLLTDEKQKHNLSKEIERFDIKKFEAELKHHKEKIGE